MLKNGNFDSAGAALTMPLTPLMPTADTTASQGKDSSPHDTETTHPVSGQTSMSLTRLKMKMKVKVEMMKKEITVTAEIKAHQLALRFVGEG